MNKISPSFEPDQLLKAWLPLRDEIGFSAIRTQKDFVKASKFLDQLLDLVGNDEKHPLADVLHYVGNHVEAYEDANFPFQKASPLTYFGF